jgi:hypothetical protein
MSKTTISEVARCNSDCCKGRADAGTLCALAAVAWTGIVTVTGAGERRASGKTGTMSAPDPHCRHRFPAEIISHAAWLYHVFSLSLRDVELILAERGVLLSYDISGHRYETGAGRHD